MALPSAVEQILDQKKTMSTTETSMPPDLQADVSSEWPSLGGSSGRPQQQQRNTAPAPPPASEDWEILNEPVQVSFDKDVIHVTKQPPRHILKHCASSPDLRGYRYHEDDDDEDDDNDDLDNGNDDDDDDNDEPVKDTATFASAAESSSIVMVPSVTSGKSTTPSKVSFRDAILLKSNGPTFRKSSSTVTPQRYQQQRKIKAKFVVTPIKRSSKSTGDLQSLLHDDDDDGHVLGETDASEYYNRKAHGYSGRQNGLKIRPDEAKRKQITLNKKKLQKQQQKASKK